MRTIDALKKVCANGNLRASLGGLLVFYLISISIAALSDIFLSPQVQAFSKAPTHAGLMKVLVPLILQQTASLLVMLTQSFMYGYFAVTIRNFVINPEQFLPSWLNNVWKYFVLGLKFNIGLIILMAIFFTIVFVIAIVLGLIFALIGSLLQSITLALSLFVFLLIVICLLPVLIITPAIQINYGMSQTFKSIFNFKRIFEIISLNKSAYTKLILQTTFILFVYISLLIVPIIFLRQYYWYFVLLLSVPCIFISSTINVLYANYIKTYNNQEI